MFLTPSVDFHIETWLLKEEHSSCSGWTTDVSFAVSTTIMTAK